MFIIYRIVFLSFSFLFIKNAVAIAKEILGEMSNNDVYRMSLVTFIIHNTYIP